MIPNFLFSDRVSSYGDAEIQGSEKEEAEGGRSGNSTVMTDQIIETVAIWAHTT